MERNYVCTKSIDRSIALWGFCLGNLTIAVLLLLIVFIVLPVRWWPVDLPTILLATLLSFSAFGLAARKSWRLVGLKVAASVCLGIGMSAIAAAGLSAAFLSGVHGSLGKNGAMIMAFIIGLLLPYLIGYPCAQLLWIHRISKDSETP